MTADELAFRIVDADPARRIIDVQDLAPAPETRRMRLPGAVNIPHEERMGKAARDLLPRRTRKVLVADTEAEGVRGARLAHLLGYENVAVLEGGLEEFTRTVLNAQLPKRELTREEQDVYHFRLQAAP
jgi:rhodanese-related sulfurtransferase